MIAPIATLRPLQQNLQRAGLYLGRIDCIPGPMTADALACALVDFAPPPDTGRAMIGAIPADWWSIPNRVAMLYAMIVAETEFKLACENLNYSAEGLVETWPSRFDARTAAPLAHKPIQIANSVYAGRNGNTEPGDGWKFRGRAWPQLTGRKNYRQFSKPLGIDLEANPDALLQIDNSAKVSVWFMAANCNMAAVDRGDVTLVRRGWNGGSNGLAAAQRAFAHIKEMWAA